MSEWWTYRPSDFLMFSPRIYWRLFESINGDFWPWSIVWVAAATAVVVRLLAGDAGASPMRGSIAMRIAAATLAAACGIVAWAFLLQRFAPIQSVAGHYALAWAMQALLLAMLAAVGGNRIAAAGRRRTVGLAIAGWALVVHPLLAPLSGRPWMQAEVFALAPDPTAIVMLGWLLATTATSRPAAALRRLLWLLPPAWCAVSAATLWTMGSAQGWVPALAALAALGTLAAARVRRRTAEPSP